MYDHAQCPNVKELQQYSLGQATDEKADRMARHLAECLQCLQTLDSLPASDTLVDAMRTHQPARLPDDDSRAIAGLVLQLKQLGTAYSISEVLHLSALAKRTAASRDVEQLHAVLARPEGPGELGRLGGYRVLKLLGVGGMGVVYLAEDVKLKRPVALKVLKPHLAASESARQRFLREAQAAAAVAHDHVVTIYEVGEDRGVPFLGMQYLEGETLEERLHREGKLPAAETLRIGREITEGLAAAHTRGLIHRDIKPANIWLEARGQESGVRGQESEVRSQRSDPLNPEPRTLNPPSGRVKILDFGLARVLSDDSAAIGPRAIAGTPEYMAPEQASGGPVDHRTDLFSLGCVLYRMCTGQLPFAGPDASQILTKIATQTPRAPADIDPKVPRPISELVMRLLAKNPRDRYHTARDVADALERSLKHSTQLAAPPRGRWSRRATILSTATAVLLAGIVIYVKTGQGTLELEVKGQDATVTIDRDKVQVIASGQTVTIPLAVGSHQIEIAQADGGKSTGSITIRWRGEQIKEVLGVDFGVVTQTNSNDPKSVRVTNIKVPFTSFRVEYVINVSSVDYAGGINFGLYNRDLNTQEDPNYAYVVFARGAGGHVIHLSAKDDQGNPYTDYSAYATFELEKWYRVVLEYDAPRHRLSAVVSEADSGNQLVSLSCENVRGFAPEMTFLGSSNLRRGGFQDKAAKASAQIRNVVFSVPDRSGHHVVVEIDPPQPQTEADFGKRKLE